MVGTEDIEKFIENQLLKKISRELKYEKFGIVSEADLQSVAYFYLKKYLSRDPRYKLYNKIYLKPSQKREGIYPDMCILREMARPIIAIEFKEHKKLQDKYVISDMRKLYRLQGMQKGYLIYLTRERSNDKTSGTLTGNAQVVGKRYSGKVIPLVINVFDKMSEQDRDKWEQKWGKYSKLRIKTRK